MHQIHHGFWAEVSGHILSLQTNSIQPMNYFPCVPHSGFLMSLSNMIFEQNFTSSHWIGAQLISVKTDFQ